MTDDEELGAVTAPMMGVRARAPTPPRRLEPHPATGDREDGRCEICRRPARGYRHPNPLRPGVVLWRCFLHCGPRFAVDDPKAAPGGGIYR